MSLPVPWLRCVDHHHQVPCRLTWMIILLHSCQVQQHASVCRLTHLHTMNQESSFVFLYLLFYKFLNVFSSFYGVFIHWIFFASGERGCQEGPSRRTEGTATTGDKRQDGDFSYSETGNVSKECFKLFYSDYHKELVKLFLPWN